MQFAKLQYFSTIPCLDWMPPGFHFNYQEISGIYAASMQNQIWKTPIGPGGKRLWVIYVTVVFRINLIFRKMFLGQCIKIYSKAESDSSFTYMVVPFAIAIPYQILVVLVQHIQRFFYHFLYDFFFSHQIVLSKIICEFRTGCQLY